MPETANKVPDTTNKVPDIADRVPDNEQEQQIYEYITENGSITTSETMELLQVKQRRARTVLMHMLVKGYLKREEMCIRDRFKIGIRELP